MRTLAVVNQKGGCGKTTIAVNLAACMAAGGQRVLLVDMDPQGHASLALGIDSTLREPTTYNILTIFKEETFPVLKVLVKADENMWLVPANIQLSVIEDELSGVTNGWDRLRTSLFEASPYYDFCLIDCPPNMGLLTMNALLAAQAALIPFDMNPLSLHAIRNVLDVIGYLKEQAGHSMKAHIIANMFDPRTNISRILLSTLLRDFGENLCKTRIHRAIRLTEAAMQGLPVRKHAPYSITHEDFVDLATEIGGNSDFFATAPTFPASILFSYLPSETSAVTLWGNPTGWLSAGRGFPGKSADRRMEFILTIRPGKYGYRLIADLP